MQLQKHHQGSKFYRNLTLYLLNNKPSNISQLFFCINGRFSLSCITCCTCGCFFCINGRLPLSCITLHMRMFLLYQWKVVFVLYHLLHMRMFLLYKWKVAFVLYHLLHMRMFLLYKWKVVFVLSPAAHADVSSV